MLGLKSSSTAMKLPPQHGNEPAKCSGRPSYLHDALEHASVSFVLQDAAAPRLPPPAPVVTGTVLPCKSSARGIKVGSGEMP